MKNSLYLSITIALCILALACGKNSKKQYSIWIVNGQDTFHTNEVTAEINCNPDHTYCRSILYNNGDNSFVLSFNTDYFPKEGIYELFVPSSNGIEAAIKLYYNDKYYHSIPYQLDTLYATLHNGKASYILSACWFVNHNNGNDSILIQGIFNEP